MESKTVRQVDLRDSAGKEEEGREMVWQWRIDCPMEAIPIVMHIIDVAQVLGYRKSGVTRSLQQLRIDPAQLCAERPKRRLCLFRGADGRFAGAGCCRIVSRGEAVACLDRFPILQSKAPGHLITTGAAVAIIGPP